MRSIGQEYSEKRSRMREGEPLRTELGERVTVRFAIQILPDILTALKSDADAEQRLHASDADDPSWPYTEGVLDDMDTIPEKYQ